MSLTRPVSCVYLFNQFTVISILWRIRFVQWWVWQSWVWVWVHLYVRFSILLWKICWWCQWHRLWSFCFDWNQVNWWRCSDGRVHAKRSRVQRWSTYRIILAPKILIYHSSSPSFKKTCFQMIVLLRPPRLVNSIHFKFTNMMNSWEPVGYICRPCDSGSGDEDRPEFIRCMDDQSLRFMKFGLSVRIVSRARFIWQHKKTSELDLSESLQQITLLQVGTGSLCSVEIQLTEGSNG